MFYFLSFSLLLVCSFLYPFCFDFSLSSTVMAAENESSPLQRRQVELNRGEVREKRLTCRHLSRIAKLPISPHQF